MATVNHPIKHFSLHRLADVELRVVADSEQGVLPLMEAECQVVTRMAQAAGWPHQAVTLFILADMSPLQRQLQALGRQPVGSQAATKHTDLLARPIVNVYDLAAPTSCHIFVNRTAMIAAGYWDDQLAIQGLLAHEHAHPFAECPASEAVRRLELRVGLKLPDAWAADNLRAADWAYKAQTQLTALAHTLAIVGPRELFTNAIVLETGFVQPLLHLNRRNVRNLVAGLAHRPRLQAQLAGAVAAGQLRQVGADTLALIGDLQGCLPLTLEVAAFVRQHCLSEAAELLEELQAHFFPQVDPLVETLFQAASAELADLSPNMLLPEMIAFVHRQMQHWVTAFAQRALTLTYQITTIDVE